MKQEAPSSIRWSSSLDEEVHIRDIVAEIVDLARRGYIKIIETEEEGFLFTKKKSYIFEKVKDFGKDLQSKDYDLKILNAIFKGSKRRKLSDLRKKFYNSIPNIKESVFSSLTSKGLFAGNPLTIRTKYKILAIIAFSLTIISIFLAVGFFGVYQDTPPFPFLVAGLVTSASLFIAGKFMPRKTKKGTEMKEYLKGYEEFISRVERDVIEKLFPPDKIPEVFEKNLPFAIAFGEEERWVNAFEDLFVAPPDWYQGEGRFSLASFAYSMDSFTTEASQILPSAPRSSGSGGGGYSGGGAGGGGGGAW